MWYLYTYPVLATAAHLRHQSKPYWNQWRVSLKKNIGNVIKLWHQRLLIANIIRLHNNKEFMLPKLILLVFNWKPGINFFQSALHSIYKHSHTHLCVGCRVDERHLTAWRLTLAQSCSSRHTVSFSYLKSKSRKLFHAIHQCCLDLSPCPHYKRVIHIIKQFTIVINVAIQTKICHGEYLPQALSNLKPEWPSHF